jgi:S-adenosylmethionine synthetase
MVGYACNENEQCLPLEYYLAKELGMYLWGFIHGDVPAFSRDIKTQVTVSYGKVRTILVSAEHFEDNTVVIDIIYDFFSKK